MSKDKETLAIDFSKFTDEDLEAYDRGETEALSDNALQAIADYEDKFNEISNQVKSYKEGDKNFGITTTAAGGAGALATGLAPRTSQKLVDKLLPEDLRGGYTAPKAAAAVVPKPTVAPAPGADYFSPFGAGEGAVKNATHNVDEVLKNKVAQAAIQTPGYVAPGNSLILQPSSSLPPPKAPVPTGSPVLPAAKPKVGVPQMRAALQSPERMPANRLPSSIKGGFAGGFGANAIENLQQGNYGDAATSGAGAASSVAAMASNPKLARAGKLGMAATILGKGYQALQGRNQEQKAAGGVVGYAGGNVVRGGLEVVQKLARAPKKSKQEIYEIAQRMAPQQLDEFVRAPGKTTSVAGKSLKQYQHEKNLKHDIVPGLQGQYSLENLKPIDWEAQRGGVSLILPGDASGVDTIRGIAGKKLANESVQEGGFPFALKFAQENPDVDPELWSSTGRAARGYFDLGKRVAQQYDTQNILPTYSKMPEGMEYALHFNDALRQGLKPNKADIRKLDKLMRQGQYKGHTFEDFKGFGDDEYVTEYMKKRPEFRKFFGARMQVQDFLKDVGLPPTYGIDTMHAVTRPELRNVETGAGGNLIGRLDLDRPKLSLSTHGTYENKARDPGFNIPGEVVGRTKYITPYEMMYPDSLMAVRANPKQAPQEFGSLKFTGARQIIDNQHADEMAMYDEAMKQLTGRAEGGQIDGYASGKKVVEAARKLILPPAENAARTQIIGTLPTYEKAANIFQQQGAAGRGIDFGAGLGQGAKALGKDFDTYEPFAQNWVPTYSKASDVPSDEYGRLTNLNVLNVVPREVRDEIVQDIGRVIQPGGMGIITTRGKDVMNAKGLAGPEPMSVITSRDTYQKGFNKDELEEYLKYMLGDQFEINRLNLGPAGALIKKKAEGGLACMKEGGSTPAWQRKEGKNPEGGLNAAGRASYNRETGGNLKAPQPEGGPRRDSFCARMSGMKKKLTSAKTANDPDSRINKALRKWNC